MASSESLDVECLPSTDSPSPISPTPYRHPDLWFSDGSVILRAQHVLFRVHKTQLARRSCVFSDMFSLPQPLGNQDEVEDDSEILDGCPVVELHDDPEDLANVLVAIYDGPAFGDNDTADFRVVAGVLRLATKYLLDALRERALEHLAQAWPATLEGWDAREERARAYEYDTGRSLYPSPIVVINLAREVHAPSLLPAAFYDLSRYTYAQIFECPECALPPFSSAAPGSPPPHIPARPHDCITSQTLSPRDLQKLALGKEAAALTVSTIIAGVSRGPPHVATHVRKVSGPHAYRSPPPPTSSCASPGTCRRDFAELATLATQHHVCERERGCADPLYVAEELGALQGVEVGECHACARALEAWARRERERVWRSVPAWFRLDGEM